MYVRRYVCLHMPACVCMCACLRVAHMLLNAACCTPIKAEQAHNSTASRLVDSLPPFAAAHTITTSSRFSK